MAKKTVKNLSPINAFLALSDSEKEAVYQSVNREFSRKELRPLDAAERKVWNRAKRKAGRPRVGRGARVISLSVEQALLERADRYAERHGITRAQLVAAGLKLAMAGGTKVGG